jgi:hypothetical protein
MSCFTREIFDRVCPCEKLKTATVATRATIAVTINGSTNENPEPPGLPGILPSDE